MSSSFVNFIDNFKIRIQIELVILTVLSVALQKYDLCILNNLNNNGYPLLIPSSVQGNSKEIHRGGED